MPFPTRETAAPVCGNAVCGNCDAHARKLSQLTVRTDSGKRLTLSLCPFCYLQLATTRAKAGRAR